MLTTRFTARRAVLTAAAIAPTLWRSAWVGAQDTTPGTTHGTSTGLELINAAAAKAWLAPGSNPASNTMRHFDVGNITAALDALRRAGARRDPGTRRTPALPAITGNAFGLIRKYRLNPLRAARLLSYLAVALHDAAARAPQAAVQTAVLIAGGAMLAHWFPDEPRGKWLNWAVQAASRPDDGDAAAVALAVETAHSASLAAIARSLYDRADPAAPGLRSAPPGATAWKAAPPLWNSRPVEPAAERWAVWLADASIADTVPAPVTQDAARYAAETGEVLALQRTLTAAQKKLADDWNLDLGTLTPAGVWVEHLLRDAAFGALTLRQQTACLSLVATAMHDAFVACWKVKFKWWTERPVTAIRKQHDANFLPYLVTPPFPSYVSGHATISGAAATVLAAIFPASAARYESDAEAAAVSRLYGGIHFRSDNDEGLRLGQLVGQAALTRVRALTTPLARALLANN